MAYSCLREFLDALDDAGELQRIAAPVSALLEAAEITDRISKSPAPHTSAAAARTDPHHHRLGGKALLFENVTDGSWPLAMNVFGSYRRMEMALDCLEGGFDALAERIRALITAQPPTGVIDKVKKGLELARLASFAPKIVRTGPVQQVVKTADQVNLFELPIIKCWPLDGEPASVGWPDLSPNDGAGRYITFGQMFTIHPDDAGQTGPRPSRNVGMYRAQVLTAKTTAMHWHIHHDGARHWRAWKKIGRPMPLAIAFGGESVLPYAATAPLPPGISELLFAGFLNHGSIPLVPCKTIDLHVPANAEIVIEGTVSTDAPPPGLRRADLDDPHFQLGPDAVLEGPFGDHTGFYSLPDRYPRFTVSAITHRRDPIYPATIVGWPPQEDYFLGKATERLFLPLLQAIVPDILDYDLPLFGAFHHCAFIKIDKQYPLQARRVMHAIWGAGQLAWTKMIFVVDADVDVHDHEQVLFHFCANSDPGRDIEQVHGPLDILDHAAPHLGAGTKIGFDATRKIPGEQINGQPLRPYPPIIEMTDSIKQQVTRRWSEYGFQ